MTTKTTTKHLSLAQTADRINARKNVETFEPAPCIHCGAPISMYGRGHDAGCSSAHEDDVLSGPAANADRDYSEALAKLAKIRTEISKRRDGLTRRSNWADAGDAEHYLALLSDIHDSLAGLGEYS